MDCDSGFVLGDFFPFYLHLFLLFKEDVNSRLRDDGYMIPIDLGAKGSCLIGGITATNAGGIRLIRYGSMHSHVTGLEVVRSFEHYFRF